MSAPLRWGVLGATSYVARLAVLPALRDSDSAVLCAVASRSAGAAARVAEKFGAARCYDSYDAVLADPDVEAVYVPLPNALHRPWVLRCAAAGKHVLCEKPLALHAGEAEEMAEACSDADVVLMEAYMTPFHPRAAAVVDLARGDLGELRFARTSFTFPLRDPENHRWKPDLGGGALLDVGIYCLSPLLAIAQREPARIVASMRPGGGGVDATTTGWLDFGDGLTAAFECSFEAPERQLLEATGTAGALTATAIFTGGLDDVEIRLLRRDGTEEVRRAPGADPYRLMVEHFVTAVRGAAPLSRPPAESVATARLLDAVRTAATG